MDREEARKFGLSLLNGIMERNESYPVYANNVRQAIEALSDQPSLPSDVDEAAENYIAPIENDEGLDYINFNGRDIKDAFKAGAEWQKQHDAELIEIAYNDGITIGMTKQKEQMLKEAVEGEVVKIFPEGAASVHYQPGFGIGEMAYFCKADGLNAGEKVRIVVLKEEEE